MDRRSVSRLAAGVPWLVGALHAVVALDWLERGNPARLAVSLVVSACLAFALRYRHSRPEVIAAVVVSHCGPPGWTSKCSSRAPARRSPPLSTCPRTASCRRR